MKLKVRAKNNKLLLSEYQKALLTEDIKKNPFAFYEIKRITPESMEQRGFLHGGVYSLWAFLDGNDYKNGSVLDKYHDYAKQEFNGEAIMIDGKRGKIGNSTKGKLSEFIETVIIYLEESYGIERSKVLDTEHYKEWRRKYKFGEIDIDNYIDYLLFLKRL